jgi:hypothetical protein
MVTDAQKVALIGGISTIIVALIGAWVALGSGGNEEVDKPDATTEYNLTASDGAQAIVQTGTGGVVRVNSK